ncbi:hypothetical protein [Streptomyces sp. NPDC102487]
MSYKAGTLEGAAGGQAGVTLAATLQDAIFFAVKGIVAPVPPHHAV